jgi:hypothetical protein
MMAFYSCALPSAVDFVSHRETALSGDKRLEIHDEIIQHFLKQPLINSIAPDVRGLIDTSECDEPLNVKVASSVY